MLLLCTVTVAAVTFAAPDAAPNAAAPEDATPDATPDAAPDAAAPDAAAPDAAAPGTALHAANDAYVYECPCSWFSMPWHKIKTEFEGPGHPVSSLYFRIGVQVKAKIERQNDFQKRL